MPSTRCPLCGEGEVTLDVKKAWRHGHGQGWMRPANERRPGRAARIAAGSAQWTEIPYAAALDQRNPA